MNPEPISNPSDDNATRMEKGRFPRPAENGAAREIDNEPLVGSLSAEELAHLETEGLLLSDVIRDIERV
jgi:hypothetical protein